MDDLFGGVVSVDIHTDNYKYPQGSGFVVFGKKESFMNAVKAEFVEIKTVEFQKKVSSYIINYIG